MYVLEDFLNHALNKVVFKNRFQKIWKQNFSSIFNCYNSIVNILDIGYKINSCMALLLEYTIMIIHKCGCPKADMFIYLTHHSINVTNENIFLFILFKQNSALFISIVSFKRHHYNTSVICLCLSFM